MVSHSTEALKCYQAHFSRAGRPRFPSGPCAGQARCRQVRRRAPAPEGSSVPACVTDDVGMETEVGGAAHPDSTRQKEIKVLKPLK